MGRKFYTDELEKKERRGVNREQGGAEHAEREEGKK